MVLRILAIMLCVSAANPAAGAPLARAALEQWLADDQVASGDFAAGTRYTAEQIATLEAVLPPGYIDSFAFPQAAIEIQAHVDYVPDASYQAASAAHGGSATLGADGAISGHVAGLPFSALQISAADARAAGFMVAWNSVFRWHYYGYRAKPVTMYYVANGDGAVRGDRPDGIGGEARIERSVEMWFHRAYLSHLAMLADNAYALDVSGSDSVHYKDFMEITAPFDVAGAKFIIERALDPYQDDQVNSYLPTERRVRRLSAQERADSFMGSEYTFDDFEGFSGRVMDYDWRLVGEKAILAVADSKHARIRVHGPHSRVADDHWQLRDCYVVVMTPRWDGHPYGAKYAFIDKQTWVVHLALVFNRDDQHWKTIDPIWQFPSLSGDTDPYSASVPHWIGTIGVDLLNGTATVSQSGGTDIPAMKPSSIRRLFDVSALNEGR